MLATDLRKRGSTPTCDGAPNKKHNDGPNRRANETCTFTGMIPAKSLTEISSDESAHNAKYVSQNETTWLVVAGCNEFR